MEDLKTNDYLKLFWLVPAIALVVPLVAILMMGARVRGLLGTIAVTIYEGMFVITPAVGVVVLLSLWVLLVFRRVLLKRINLGATIRVGRTGRNFTRHLPFARCDLIRVPAVTSVHQRKNSHEFLTP